MKRLIAQTALAIPIWFSLSGAMLAVSIWFVPPQRQFAPTTNTQILFVRDGNQVTMTIQPQFSGTATDFALVLPFPSEPTLSEAPDDIFIQLEEATHPIIDVPQVLPSEDADVSTPSADDVTVIAERDIGDFSTVTLSATSEVALTEWLQQEGYELSEEKAEIIGEYVDRQSYFIALKVNMQTANIDDSGFLSGELRPMSFEYEALETMVPLQLMATESSLASLTVYALGEDYSYVPGAEIRFARKVDANVLRNAPSLEAYDGWQQWLVRNYFQVQTDEIRQDVTLHRTDDERVVSPGDTPIILNPDKLPGETGVLVSTNGVTVYTQEVKPSELIVREESSLFNASMVILLSISNIALLVFIIIQHNTHASSKK